MIFLLIFMFSLFSSAQVIEAPFNNINFEQNPPEIVWQKIDTEHFEIIFPKEIANEAQRVAHILEKAWPFVTRSLESTPPRIPLVLQNQSVQSNGFVTLAPRRTEWYVTPSVDPELSNTEWLKTLGIHELRHVVQFEKSRQGFNRYFEIFLGEAGQALGLGLTVPPWFLEGDAVGIETALTPGGRGRLPLFERDLRTLLLSGENYSYDKTHLGSYEDYVPNHYVYGYFLTTHFRNTYGDMILSRIMNESSERSYNPMTFYNTIDSFTDSFEDFYAETMRNLVSEWSKKLETLKLSPYEVKPVDKVHGWTNYLYPQFTKEGKVLALKRGLSFINHFVLLDGDKEKTLFYPAPLIQEYPYKLRNNRLAYLEREYDPRWGYREYSRLKVWDLNREEVILDLRDTKLRLAVLNASADKLLAVEWNEEQEQFIVALDLTGKVIRRVPYPEEEVITSLDWSDKDSVLLVVKDHNDLKSLVEFNLQSAQKEYLLEKSIVNLGFVAHEKGRTFIESPESGIDNLYLYEGKNQLTQLTSSKYGAYTPDFNGNKLLYNEYTLDGMRIVTKEGSWKENYDTSNSFVPFYEKFITREDYPSLNQSLRKKSEDFPVTEYSQTDNALNFHSWLILAPPLSNSIILQAFSQDILNKFLLSVGGNYNLNERTSQAFVSAAWSHYYPVFDIRAAYGSRRQDIVKDGKEEGNKWEEGTAEVGIQIPWRKLSGRFTQDFKIRSFAKVIKVTNKSTNDLNDISDGTLFSPGIEASFDHVSRMARRDLFPPWGVRLDAHVEEGKDISGDKQEGSLQSYESRFFLPGLYHHHAFFHQLAYEKQNDEKYQYASRVFYPRGTRSFFLDEFSKYSGNYSLPLFYPDWNLSRYFYLKRVSFNAFYDEINGRFENIEYRAASAGWEFILDTHFLRLFVPISWGIRGNYIINGEDSNSYEIFLSSAVGSF